MDDISKLIEQIISILDNIGILLAVLTPLIAFILYLRQRNIKAAIQITCDIKPWLYGTIRNLTNSQRLQWHMDNNEISYSYLTIHITVTSEIKEKEIQLAPYLVIRTLNTERIPWVEHYLVQGDAGGWVEIHGCLAILSPDQTVISPAPIMKEIEEFQIHDSKYYYQVEFEENKILALKPGESEIFELKVKYIGGYHYTFQIGVQYRYRGKSHIKWIDRELTIGVPSSAKHLYFATNFPTPMGQNVKISHLDGLVPGNAREIMKKAWQIADNSTFTLHRK